MEGLSLGLFQRRLDFDKGVLTVKAESELKEAAGLVGLAGAYFSSSLLSASDCKEVLEAWDWIQKRLGSTFEQLSFWLTSHFILKSIFEPQLDLELIAPIELAVRLHRLAGLLDIEVKELQTFLKGNVKYWSEHKSCKIVRQVEEVVRHICNFESEVDLALLAKTHNFEVELAKTPDMYINEVAVDVKNLAWSTNLPTQSYTRKVIERGQKAFNQKASLAALSIGLALKLLRLSDESKEKAQEWCSILNKGLKLARDDKKPIFLFYHNPWTDDVTAQVDTLKDLKEKLALTKYPDFDESLQAI